MSAFSLRSAIRTNSPQAWHTAARSAETPWSSSRSATAMRDDLPTGTVTFLFTDVEGSTTLLHELARRRTCGRRPSTGTCCGRCSRATAASRSTHRATRSSSRSRVRGRARGGAGGAGGRPRASADRPPHGPRDVHEYVRGKLSGARALARLARREAFAEESSRGAALDAGAAVRQALAH